MLKKEIGIILIIAALIIAVLVNIYKPFITSAPSTQATSAAKLLADTQRQKLVEQVRAEFAYITEESLMKYNTDKNIRGFNTNTQSAVSDEEAQELALSDTRLVVNEGFDATQPIVQEAHEFRLFYRPDCTYSMAFMPIWLEISKSVPSNVTVKEINCGVLDANGVSTCANWLEYGGGITSVPALQLVSNIVGVKSTQNYTGQRSYKQLQEWLRANGITLRYNPNAEHFNDTNPLGYSYGAKEGFSDGPASSIFESGDISSDAGKLADDYDKAFLELAQEDAYGHIRDVDKDGYYTASFSICQPTPDSPEGYQVFTRRGQWGCVVPDTNSGIATPFDAAFASVDNYLSLLPHLTDPATGKHTGATRTDEQRMAMKRGMAAKYAKDIRAFGLCDEPKLRQKYNTYESVKAGKAKLPDGVTLKDYLDTQESAAAIYGACQI